nr:putative peptide methionine sulfoxide reductase MrsB [Tanacetum cinerariifolium]
MSQDVSYSCGKCGYQLYLSSSKRTCEAASKYHDSIKKGSLTFLAIDPSRFTEIHEVSCLPISLGRNGSKTKLMCRQCGVHVGYGYKEGHAAPCVFDSGIGSARYKKIVVMIGALQPSDIVNEERTEERTGSGQVSEIVEIGEETGQNGATH